MSGAGEGTGDGKGGDGKGGDGGTTHTPLDAATRQTFFKSLSPDNLDFAEKNGFYKKDGSHYADPNVIVDSYRNAEKLLGADRLPAPDLSNDEAFDKWLDSAKLGVARDPKDVKITPKKMPDGVEYDQAAEDRLRQRLVQGRVPAKFHQSIYDAEVETRLGEIAKQTADTAAEKTRIETDLRKEHGVDFEARRTAAWEALTHISKLAGVDPVKFADQASVTMGGQEMAKFMIQLGKMMGEDTIKGAGDAGFAKGPAAAKAELDRLNGDPEHRKAAGDRTNPGHKAAVEREERLNKLIHG
jgi:hypothetical protein